jgi:D-lactate dehydrogenase
MLAPTYQKFKNILSHTIAPKRILTKSLQTLAYGTDTSFYIHIRKIVILAHNETEVFEIIKQAKLLDIALTFRAAATSL